MRYFVDDRMFTFLGQKPGRSHMSTETPSAKERLYAYFDPPSRRLEFALNFIICGITIMVIFQYDAWPESVSVIMTVIGIIPIFYGGLLFNSGLRAVKILEKSTNKS